MGGRGEVLPEAARSCAKHCTRSKADQHPHWGRPSPDAVSESFLDTVPKGSNNPRVRLESRSHQRVESLRKS